VLWDPDSQVLSSLGLREADICLWLWLEIASSRDVITTAFLTDLLEVVYSTALDFLRYSSNHSIFESATAAVQFTYVTESYLLRLGYLC
jgi:hypothetical protein